MKVISIGRNPDCNIVLTDNMVSRRHALIKIYPTGKYELVSTGSNGTKVNGNQIAQNQPYPVKRGDSITFAHVANLDWNLVPDPMKPIKIGALAALGVIILVVAWIFLAPLFGGGDDWGGSGVGGGGGNAPEVEQRNDSTKVDTVKTIPSPYAEKQDVDKDKKKDKDKNKDKKKDKNKDKKQDEKKPEQKPEPKQEAQDSIPIRF